MVTRVTMLKIIGTRQTRDLGRLALVMVSFLILPLLALGIYQVRKCRIGSPTTAVLECLKRP